MNPVFAHERFAHRITNIEWKLEDSRDSHWWRLVGCSYMNMTEMLRASRGLGLATSKAISESFPTYHIFRGCRHLKPETEGIQQSLPSNTSEIQLDVTNNESIELAAKYITENYGKLDVLINNAGISSNASSLTDNLNECISTNLLGSSRVTEAFLPLLKKSTSARIVFLTSVLGSINARSDPSDPFSQL
ncbi:hypothetical protein HYALB_00004141 [Hymenoscyphus albidus]|uniref:NAD(P)-binding protein n=1 Tax=Hymenoscyphus albidus TaxID=595503 RepID=A0A9N9Q006_9HELO|nr:hypothetical protein HYALB_00004141 [Hymenoscyphus albidus]